MYIIAWANFLLFASVATLELDVNTTVGESTILPCNLMISTLINLDQLRFHWQDDRNMVLYSFNKGKEMPQHVTKLYLDRVTAFPQDMTTGNMSVKLKNLTLEDDKRVLQCFVTMLHQGRAGYLHEPRKISQITLHVAVRYSNVSLAVNEETKTAVCTAQAGFPVPSVKWTLLSNNSHHLVDPRDVNTSALQGHQDQLYSLKSTIAIPAGRYQSVTCYIFNPTLNETLIKTFDLKNGEAAVKSLATWTNLLAIFVPILLLLLIAGFFIWRKLRQNQSSKL